MVTVSKEDVMITCMDETCSGAYVDEKSGAYYVGERRDDLFAGEGCGAFMLVRGTVILARPETRWFLRG